MISTRRFSGANMSALFLGRHRRPQPSRAAAHRATDAIGRLYGVAANHLSNERHPTSPWQVKLVAEKRWKRPFHRTILPFATETSLGGPGRPERPERAFHTRSSRMIIIGLFYHAEQRRRGEEPLWSLRKPARDTRSLQKARRQPRDTVSLMPARRLRLAPARGSRLNQNGPLAEAKRPLMLRLINDYFRFVKDLLNIYPAKVPP
jgi:hypothetical protein